VRFFGGRKWIFDAEMQFDAARFKPHAATRSQISRLWHLSKSKHVAIKRSSAILLSVWHRNLHVIYSGNHY
jgi:hypothetical protein